MAEESDSKVLSILDSIIISQETSSGEVTSSAAETPKTKKKKADTPRGVPKSGRFWKSKKEKFSTINKTKGLRSDFAKKTALRLELERVKEMSKQVQEEAKQKQLEKKERRKDNLKRAEENKRKSEVVQVITNTAKLKRMKKKQLRFIQKRDLNKPVEAST